MPFKMHKIIYFFPENLKKILGFTSKFRKSGYPKYRYFFLFGLALNSLHAGKLHDLMLFAVVVCFFSKLDFQTKFFQKYHVEKFGSRSGPTFCQETVCQDYQHAQKTKDANGRQ